MTELASEVKISAENVLDANDQALANILNKRKYDNIETLTTKNFFLSHDPGQRSKIENDNLRNYLIELGPHQVKLNNFPINKDIDKRKQNHFSSLWYKEYPHLEYSILKDSAFCYVCCLFPNGPGRENSEVAWVKNGIRTWHKMKSRGKKGKRGKLSEHFSSKSHKASLLDYCNYCNSAQHNNLLLDKKQRQIVISEKEEMESNKCVIKVLIDLARTLGRQGIAFRGDDQDENGNFRQLVYFMSRHNLVLKRWLSNIKLRKYHVTYMSAKSQNDFIHLLGQDVQSKIVSEVNQASMFSIMADTTPDVSHSDKLAIAVRYVDNNCNIKERIVQICEVADKTGDGIADLIISIINNLQLDVNSVVFQGYDYASSMSSNIKGVHAKISEKLKRVVPYIPCQAHRTNTFVEHAVKRNKMASNVFEVLEMCYVFISSSTKRFSLLNSKLEFIENSLKLCNLSKTRWSARSEAFWISMESIVECFYEISQSDLFDKKTKDQALAILKKIVNPDFIIMLMLIKGVIAKTKILTDELQKVELNILDAKMIVLSTIQSLERNRKEEFEVHCEIDAAIKICSKYEIDALKIYEDRHRRRVTPKRYDDNPDTLCSRNIYQYYTQQLNCVLDCLIYEMNENLLASWLSIEPFSLLQQSTKTFTINDVEKLCLLMPNNGVNTDAHLFHAELEIFMNTFTKSDAPTNNEKLKLSWQRQNIFPGVFKAFKLMASAPVSVASDERTFSKLKIVKNILRSTMSDARLASLILLASEKDLVDNIDLDVLVKKWSITTQRRIQIE